MSDSFFTVESTDPNTLARNGLLRFNDGRRVVTVATPVFMPVGTQGTVKALWQEDLEEIGYDLILSNTYHLYMRPGEIIKEFGGLKPFMSWEDHAILTDSGGFQVFSLSDRIKFREEGVEFSSHLDGSRHLFTPEKVIDFQNLLGSDIMMVLDDCPPASADRKRAEESLDRTHRWARNAIDHRHRLIDEGKMDPVARRVFGISQGHMDLRLRVESLQYIQSLPFDGIAVGGLSVGESREQMYEILEALGPNLDSNRPRYLMGVGTIPDFLEAVKNGIDMFDCVLPTRNARNGQALTSLGKVNVRNASHSLSTLPLDSHCNCKTCRRYSVGYIRHLFKAKEMLGSQLITYHNLYFFHSFMTKMRSSIQRGEFLEFYKHWKAIPF